MDKQLIPSDNLFPVAGIGASAGGLAAFTGLIRAIPRNSGLAYVLVQHLDPDYESSLPDLLQKVTEVPVLVITDEIKVAPDHIYIIPSNKMLIANDGVLELSPRPQKSKGHLNLPIDLFFRSLAEVHGPHAIGIVLSGKASDGTAGLAAIRHMGGVTIAQDPASADYPQMPRSAIEAGVVDHILLPEDIPAALILHKQQVDDAAGAGASFTEDEGAYSGILAVLAGRHNTDFTFYKQSTIRRRIARRIREKKCADPAAYLPLLLRDLAEQDTLYQELLIPVTAFFRDNKVFDALRKTVFPQLAALQAPGGTLRIWIAACSTGQEAYSIAMCVREYTGDTDRKVQLFATDISEAAIAKARSGVYTAAEMADMPAKRLSAFFTKTEEGFRVNKDIRDMCVFAVHNFLSDPPFSRIDFISCRNVLIYLQPYLQKKALAAFHYALNSAGYLLLGKSETAAATPQLFGVADRGDKLFSRKDAGTSYVYSGAARPERLSAQSGTTTPPKKMQTDFQKIADEVVLSDYAPVGVVVNAQLDVVHFRGDTSPYIRQAQGIPTHNLMKLVNSGLAFELRNAILKARKSQTAVVKDNIPLRSGTVAMNVTITAIALANTTEPHCLVLFQESPGAHIGTVAAAGRSASRKDQLNQHLQKELAQNREDMRAVTEEQETANEELQSANEELLSSSEEMQSLNEELETSKEELQSTNEELMVINQELLSLNLQVSAARTYSEAIVATIHQPLLVLDKSLRVQTANQSFYKTFRVNEHETEGTLVYDLGNRQWNIPALRTLLEEVLPERKEFDGFEVTHTFTSIGTRTILLSGVEIMRDKEEEKLILLVIEDITLRRQAEDLLKVSEAKFRKMADAMPQKVWTADANGAVNYFNQCWLDYTGRTFGQLKNRGWKEIIHPDDLDDTKKSWQRSVKTGENYEIEHRFLKSDGTYRWHLSRGLVHNDQSGYVNIWITTSTEIQKQKERRQQLESEVVARTNDLEAAVNGLRAKNEELEKLNMELEAFAYVSSHDLQEPLRKIETFSKMIQKSEQAAMTDAGKDYFLRIQSAAGRMRRLIEDLLKYSQTATNDRCFETVNLGTVVADVLRNMNEALQENSARVEVGELGDVTINVSQFRQVLENLLSNALKFARPRTPLQINISAAVHKARRLCKEDPLLSAAQLSAHPSFCRITVRDNGIGFDPQYNTSIFGLFERLHSKEDYPGTGIGLSIVKKIIEHHGGTITASGVLGKGAAFHIYIPPFRKPEPEKKMKLIIKYMVSIRCKALVREVLTKMGLHSTCLSLGEVEVMGTITAAQREEIGATLLSSGLVLMDDARAMLISRIKAVITEMVHHTEEMPRVNISAHIAEKLEYNYTHLANLFSETEGITITQYILRHKIERVKELILYNELNLTEIAFKMQYSSVAHLSRQFKQITGLTPSFFRQLRNKRRTPLEDL